MFNSQFLTCHVMKTYIIKFILHIMLGGYSAITFKLMPASVEKKKQLITNIFFSDIQVGYRSLRGSHSISDLSLAGHLESQRLSIPANRYPKSLGKGMFSIYT